MVQHFANANSDLFISTGIGDKDMSRSGKGPSGGLCETRGGRIGLLSAKVFTVSGKV